MIVASQKSIDEILKSLEGFNSVVVAACGTCVTVCMSGGEKEALKIADALVIEAKAKGKKLKTFIAAPTRQCDMEFLDEHEESLDQAECILSLGCGAGVQFMAEKFPDKMVLPGLNTEFIGVNRDLGYWTEMCQGCGNCLLAKTGAVCPVARCSKSNFNGPCGGSATGKCEVDDDIDCGWQLIYDRMKRLGRLDELLDISEIRSWQTSRDGGPRSVKRQDMIVT